MQNAPKELLLELLKYSGAISQPKIKFWVSHSQSLGRYHVHVLIPEKGLRGHEFVIAVVNQIEQLKQFDPRILLLFKINNGIVRQ